MNAIKGHFILLLGVVYLGCSEWDLERAGFTQVITIGAIEVGSNSAFLIGDIENIREANIVESGFILSSAASEDQNLRLDLPGVVQVPSPGLDTISEDRAFAARVSGLAGSTEYFFRGYVLIEGEEQVAYGNIDQFQTNELSISIETIRKTSQDCSTEILVQVLVRGYSEGSDEQVKLVYSTDINNLEPTVGNGIVVEGGTPDVNGIIDVRMNIDCGLSYFLRAQIDQDNSISLYSETYAFSSQIAGDFHVQASFPGTPRDNPLSFVLNDRGFVGGVSKLRAEIGVLYEYVTSENSWYEVIGFERLNVREAVSIKVENEILITTGLLPYGECWQGVARTGLDGTEFTYEQLCPSCSGCIGGSLRGIDSGEPLDFGRYTCQCYFQQSLLVNPTFQQFDEIEFFPAGSRKGAIHITVDDRVFLVGGELIEIKSEGTFEYCTISTRSCPSDVLEISNNPLSSTHFDRIPGAKRFKMVGFTIDDVGFLGLGLQCTQNCLEGEIVNSEGLDNYYVPIEQIGKLSDFYSFKPDMAEGNRWQELSPFPGKGRSLIGFSIAKKGYVISKLDNGIKNLWEFDPGLNGLGQWKLLQILPVEPLFDPQAVLIVGNRAYLYIPNSPQNFWMYIPELN